jgi:fatty acid desaturase
MTRFGRARPPQKGENVTRDRIVHFALVAAWWLVALGLAGEFGTKQGQDNAALPWLFLGWIAFGVWRVVRKYRQRRAEERMQ